MQAATVIMVAVGGMFVGALAAIACFAALLGWRAMRWFLRGE